MAITLIVENGSKPAGANTYVSLVDAATYHATFGNSAWTDLTDDDIKSQALVLATQSVDLLYGERYDSAIFPSSTQELLWPRMWFTDANQRIVLDGTIPKALKDAVAEIALLSLDGVDIFPLAATAQNVRDQTIQVGGISISTSNYRPNSGESFTGFRKVDIVIRPILKRTFAGWSLKA
jgi:hypothetical protein